MSYYDWAVGLSTGQAAARRANAEVSQANDVTHQWIHYARQLEARVKSLEAEKQSIQHEMAMDTAAIERIKKFWWERVGRNEKQIVTQDEQIAQRDELIAQRDELIAQRDELIAQRDDTIAWLKGYIDDLRDGIVTLD